MFKYYITIIFLTLQITSVIFSQEAGLPEKENIKSLIEKFKNDDPFLNGDMILELAGYGETAIPYLIKSLQDENENVRFCSAVTIGKIAPLGGQVIPHLIKSLYDKNSNVKWATAIALGKYKTDAVSAIPYMQNLLYDLDSDVRWAAYVSLSKIDKEALRIKPDFNEIIKKIEELTPELMKELNVPGVSITIIRNNELSWSRCFGVSDSKVKNVISDQTMFEACSMSKPVFAYLVMTLVENGKLDLDKPLCNYLQEEFISPDEDYSGQITARMVLTHTGGMPNWRKGGDERNAPLPVYFKPGSKFLYSGEGFYYLQRVVEHIIKEPLDSYAKKNLFDKLGLQSASFVWKEELNERISTGHNDSGEPNARSKYLRPNAAYTLYISADDYARFITEIMKSNSGSGMITELRTKDMLAHQFPSDVREVIERPGSNMGLFSYRGLGWAIDSTITGNIAYHSGSNQTGFKCYSQFNTESQSGIVIMTNSVNGNELWRRLVSQVGDL